MDNVSVALCIPTYERDKIVEDFLINCSMYYVQAGIDIYYYDSSISDKTKDVICGWPDQEHIHYIRVSSKLPGMAKVFKIFQGYGLKKEYDFIWLAGDAVQYKEAAIAQFVSNLSLDYDMVVINGVDREKIGTRVFTDPNEFLQMCAWHLTLFGAAALNSHTMLSDVNWAFYEEIFLTPTLRPFIHVSFYFYRILELEQFRAFHLSVPSPQYKMSKLKTRTGWAKKYFFIVCEAWVQTIEGLPDFYTAKESACIKWGDLHLFKNEIDKFFLLKKHGIYSLEIYRKYKDVWSKVTSIPSMQLLVVALMPKSLINLYDKSYKIFLIAKLRMFCKKHSRIMIYGAGDNGEIYDQLFKSEGLRYEAFCVSHRKPNKTEYLHHPVHEFDEMKNASKGIGFVIALAKGNAEEVLPVMTSVVNKKHIFYEPNLQTCIRRERGSLYTYEPKSRTLKGQVSPD